ncbi:MAG: ATP-binding cassette domain-containing protein [Bacteroidia bacterium]
MLKTHELTFSYDGNRQFLFPDIKVDSGEHLLVLGRSGKGKTTLLHLLAGFLSQQSGTIEINGQKLEQLSGFKKDQFRAKRIGVVFQVPHFISSLTVEQNILWAQKLARLKPDIEKVRSYLKRLNLEHRAKAHVQKLSQGELQRASIIRGIINDPAVVLADEPTSSLDDENCTDVIKLLEEQTDAVGAALVVVTHDQRIKDFFTNSIQL